MRETQLQEKFIIPFFRDNLSYQEVKANTVSNSLIIEEDLEIFISTTELNQKPYPTKPSSKNILVTNKNYLQT